MGCAGVVFDVDDTLYDVVDLFAGVWREHRAALAVRGVDADQLAAAFATVAAASGGGAHPWQDQVVAALAVCAGPLAQAGWLRELAETQVPAWLPARPGARELLLALRAGGVPVAVLTNGDRDRQVRKVQALGLTCLVDVLVVAGCDGVPAKPDPGAFTRVARLLAAPAEELVMVGDRPDFDITPALAVGMRAVRLACGHHRALAPAPGAHLDTSVPQVAWGRVRALAGLTDTPRTPVAAGTSVTGPILAAAGAARSG